MAGSKSKILICLVHWGSAGQCGHQREYFLKCLEEYNKSALKYSITLHVFLTEDTIDWSRYPNLKPIKHIYDESISNRLPREHKQVMIDNADNYDWFLYSEDDVLITQDHLDAVIEHPIEHTYVIGYVRYELKPGNKYKFLVDLHPAHSCHRGGNVPVKARHILNGEEYIEPYNVHSACYIVNREQFRHALANGYKNDTPWYANGPMESVASNIYWNCGLTKVIPMKDFQRFMVHHLADRYVNALPTVYTEQTTPSYASI